MGKYNICKQVMAEYFWLYQSNTERFDKWIDWQIEKYTKKPKEIKETVIRDRWIEFVYLSKDEYNKLISEIWEKTIKEYIFKLNNYIGSTGKNYKSHYYTILNWIKRDWVKYNKEKIDSIESIQTIVRELTEEEKEEIKKKMINIRSNFSINNM